MTRPSFCGLVVIAGSAGAIGPLRPTPYWKEPA
jgi:hypothetical protein